jgi:hypothetical protein
MDIVLDVADAKGEKAGYQAADRVAGKPNAYAGGHFVARVPCRSEEHEAGGNGGFGDTQEEANGHEAAKAVARSRQGNDDAPEHSVGGEIFAGWQASNQDGGGIFPEQIAKILECTVGTRSTGKRRE